MGAFPPRLLRLGVVNVVGSIEEISVVTAERENDAIIDLWPVLESKPTIPKVVIGHAKIDRLYGPSRQQFVHLSLCIGRQRLVGRYPGAVGVGITDKRVAAKGWYAEAWTPIASPH